MGCEAVLPSSDIVVTSQSAPGKPPFVQRAPPPLGWEPSLSAMVSVRPAGADTPLPPDAAPETVTVLSDAWTSLFTAVIVTVSVLVVSPGAITSALFALSA